MVTFLAHLYGPSCEMLLHDVFDSENSVVAEAVKVRTGEHGRDAVQDIDAL